MADIYTDAKDEELIQNILRHGLETKAPKHTVLRIALAKSMRIQTKPDRNLDRIQNHGSEYALEQITGYGMEPDFLGKRDHTDSVKAMLGIYHEEDLFSDGKRFRLLLQRHIRRGLREIRLSWRQGHDFHAYLHQELFSGSIIRETEPEFEKKLILALRDIGVTTEIKDKLDGPRLSRFFLFLPDVNHLDKLRRGLEKLALSLGFQQQGLFIQATDKPKMLGLDVPRPIDAWRFVGGMELINWVDHKTPQDALLQVWPGVDVLGNPYGFDLSTVPHLLVAGTTGSGKSVCMHSILLSLLRNYSSDMLKLVLIDPKQVEFAAYSDLPHLYGGEVAFDSLKAIDIIDSLVEEIENRNSELKNAGVVSLAEGYRKNRLSLPWIVVFVEEMADLFLQSRAVEQGLIQLAQKARSVGIHLVLSTQRPDAETFNGLLRSNIPGRIALAVQKSSESKIVLDETGAEKLLGKGDMLIKAHTGSSPDRVHGVLINRDDIAACVRAARKME